MPFYQRERLIDLEPSRSLYVRETGAGAPLVLIHGALTTHADWLNRLVEPLAARHRVFAIDRPGHGRSRRPRFAAAPRAQARHIREALRLDAPAVLVAHSFAAMVALAWAEEFPDEIAKLVLVSPLCFPEPRLIEHLYLAPRAAPVAGPAFSAAVHGVLDGFYMDAVTRMMFAPQQPPPGWRDQMFEDQNAASFVVQGEDAAAIGPWSPAAYVASGAWRAPLHLVLGGADMIIRHHHQGLVLAALTGDARVSYLPEIGHMAHHAAPDAVIACVEQETPARRRAA